MAQARRTWRGSFPWRSVDLRAEREFQQFSFWLVVSNLVGSGVLYGDRALLVRLFRLEDIAFYNVPLEMLGAASCQRLIRPHGFEVMLLDKRVNFKMPNKGYEGGGAQFPVIWLTWQILPNAVSDAFRPVPRGLVGDPDAIDTCYAGMTDGSVWMSKHDGDHFEQIVGGLPSVQSLAVGRR